MVSRDDDRFLNAEEGLTGKQPNQKYCCQCAAIMHESALACPKCGAQQGMVVSSGTTSRRLPAAVIALLLGGFGIHHFYLGNTARGVIYLIFFWTLIPTIIALVEGIVWLCQSDQEFEHNHPRTI